MKLLIVSALFAAMAVSPSQAATHQYPSGGDLDSILAIANDGDTIEFHEGLTGRTVLLDKSLTLVGAAPGVEMDGVVFEAARDDVTLAFRALSFTGESGIWSKYRADVTLTIEDCRFHDIPDFDFGMIYALGELAEQATSITIDGCEFTNVLEIPVHVADTGSSHAVFHDLMLTDSTFQSSMGCIIRGGDVQGCRFYDTQATFSLRSALNLDSYWYAFPRQTVVTDCDFVGGTWGISSDTTTDIVTSCRFRRLERGIDVGWTCPGACFVTIIDLEFCEVDEPWHVSNVGELYDGGGHVFDECEPCGDLDGDWSVGFNDLAMLLGSWGQGGAPDLDGDGSVGFNDLAILLGSWGPCPPPF